MLNLFRSLTDTLCNPFLFKSNINDTVVRDTTSYLVNVGVAGPLDNIDMITLHVACGKYYYCLSISLLMQVFKHRRFSAWLW